MKLLIDAGNTCLKWAILDGQFLSEQQRCFYSKKTATKQFSDLLEELFEKQNVSISDIIMVSVLGDMFNQQAHKTALYYCSSFSHIQSIEVLVGVKNAYDDPSKLGADRFVGLIAAYHLSNKRQEKKKACIIVDSGTATTIDAVDAQGQHLGGLILPGLDLCSRSLLKNTQQLPLWGAADSSKDLKCNLFSTNTSDAIYTASILGLSGAIEHISLKMEDEIKSKEGSVQVDKYLCGGSTQEIFPYLNSDFQPQEDLIMLGLKLIAKS